MFGSYKTKGPKEDSQHQLRSPMTEGDMSVKKKIVSKIIMKIKLIDGCESVLVIEYSLAL